ncbi:hypothetical protein PC116_g29576 [Phytophthora cactorum]|nr:hypothetical protein PC116_g29576 [Phytophthora cactorum]
MELVVARTGPVAAAGVGKAGFDIAPVELEDIVPGPEAGQVDTAGADIDIG